MIQAIHTAVKGRSIYKIDRLYSCESLKTYLERSLVEKAEISNVSVNSLTGIMLVLYHPDKTPDEIASLIEESVLNYHVAQEQIETKSCLPKTLQQLTRMVADAEAQAAENQQFVLAGATQFAPSAVYLISIPFM